MKSEMRFYLFASIPGTPDESPATVFHHVRGEVFAAALCRLFTKEYASNEGRPVFHHKAAELIAVDEQVLLDESLDCLDLYDDPDPGVYEPRPSKDTLLLAQYAARAKKWEELLRERTEGDQHATADHNDSDVETFAGHG